MRTISYAIYKCVPVNKNIKAHVLKIICIGFSDVATGYDWLQSKHKQIYGYRSRDQILTNYS